MYQKLINNNYNENINIVKDLDNVRLTNEYIISNLIVEYDKLLTNCIELMNIQPIAQEMLLSYQCLKNELDQILSIKHELTYDKINKSSNITIDDNKIKLFYNMICIIYHKENLQKINPEHQKYYINLNILQKIKYQIYINRLCPQEHYNKLIIYYRLKNINKIDNLKVIDFLYKEFIEIYKQHITNKTPFIIESDLNNLLLSVQESITKELNNINNQNCQYNKIKMMKNLYNTINHKYVTPQHAAALHKIINIANKLDQLLQNSTKQESNFQLNTIESFAEEENKISQLINTLKTIKNTNNKNDECFKIELLFDQMLSSKQESITR